MKRSFFLASLVALLAAAMPIVARAQPSDADRVTARALAREGYEAQMRGEYAVAADRFSRAEALVDAPTLLLGLARAQVGLGKLLEAQEVYERIVREPLAPNAPAPFGKAVDDAKRELADLTPRIAWITVAVSGPRSPEVTLDDAPVPAAALGVRWACNPGEHWLKVSAAGFAPAERTFIAAEGSEQTISLHLDALPQPTAVAVSGASETRRSTGIPPQTKIAIAAFGVGAAGLIAGGAAGVWVLADHSSLSARCPDGHCAAPSDTNEVRTYRTVADFSTAAFVAGGVLAAAGIALIFTTPKARAITAYAGLQGAGIAGRF